MSASMGPQLYRCGNREIRYIVVCCNGICFNGAATLSLRKCPRREHNNPWNARLQWGRNFIVAEITVFLRTMTWMPCFNGAATLSLRKCQPVACRTCLRTLCFNGAATLSLQKFHIEPFFLPHSCTCFNGAATLSLRKYDGRQLPLQTKNRMLQWGRNFIVAEIQPQPRKTQYGFTSFNGAATLSLRKYRCGSTAWPR